MLINADLSPTHQQFLMEVATMPKLPVSQSKSAAGACCAPGCCDDSTSDAVTTVAAEPEALTATVREKYGAAARRVLESVENAKEAGTSCCEPVSSCCGGAA